MSIGTNVLIFIGAVYVGAYYVLARNVLSGLELVDKDYFKHLGASGGMGASNSLAIVRMLLDDRVPKPHWQGNFRFRFNIVRGMFFISPFAFIVMFILL